MDGLAVPIIAIICGTIIVLTKTILGSVRSSDRQDKKPSRAESAQSMEQLVELSELASRMQTRIESLERLLDTTQPEWRGKP